MAKPRICLQRQILVGMQVHGSGDRDIGDRRGSAGDPRGVFQPCLENGGELVEAGRLGLERAQGIAEPEDHIATECEVYAGLLSGSFDGGAPEAEAFFGRHLGPWAGRFFADLEKAEAARFYGAVGQLGRVAVEIEQAAMGLPR
jgi:hypothetical protein